MLLKGIDDVWRGTALRKVVGGQCTMDANTPTLVISGAALL